jgi:penicillin-binding protein 1A
MLVNGGKWIAPTLIDRIQDRRGLTVYRHDKRTCEGCQALSWHNQPEPKIPDNRLQVIDSGTAYQVVSMLDGVVRRGTGVRIKAVGKPLGGKTGTTNDSNDTWFVGFSPDLALGVYVGFDTPQSLGRRETGSSIAVPIFRDFMAEALEGQPGIPFRIPPGVRLVRVNARTGLTAQPGEKRTILEAFKPGTEPTLEQRVLDGSQDDDPAGSGGTPRAGTGGLY